jgi:hypothetical protein
MDPRIRAEELEAELEEAREELALLREVDVDAVMKRSRERFVAHTKRKSELEATLRSEQKLLNEVRARSGKGGLLSVTLLVFAVAMVVTFLLLRR